MVNYSTLERDGFYPVSCLYYKHSIKAGSMMKTTNKIFYPAGINQAGSKIIDCDYLQALNLQVKPRVIRDIITA